MADKAPAREITLGGTLAETMRAQRWAAALADAGLLPVARLHDVELCLEEALVNIVRHGLAGNAQPIIRLRFVARPGGLVIEIEDNGAPFDPARFEPRPPARSLDEAELGGLGIPLMRKFADGVRYERAGALNRLSLDFAAGSKRSEGKAT